MLSADSGKCLSVGVEQLYKKHKSKIMNHDFYRDSPEFRLSNGILATTVGSSGAYLSQFQTEQRVNPAPKSRIVRKTTTAITHR